MEISSASDGILYMDSRTRTSIESGASSQPKVATHKVKHYKNMVGLSTTISSNFLQLRAFSWEAEQCQAREAHGFREGFFRYDDIVISYIH